MSTDKRRTYLGHPSWSPLQMLTEVGSYNYGNFSTQQFSGNKKYLSINVKYGSAAQLYQGCCVAPVWQGARAWLPRTVHYQPTERQDATDAGRGASARLLLCCGGSQAATPTPTEVQRSPCVTRGHALVTHWSRVHTCRTLGAAFLPTPWLHHCTVCTAVANIRVECSNFI